MKYLNLPKIISTLVLATAVLTVTGIKMANAQYYSQGSEAEIVVDKTISADNGKSYADNIAASVKTFTEDSQIYFKIVIENKGNKTLTNVKFTDYLPRYLSLLFYPGVYDKSLNQIQLNMKDLNPGESKAYLVIAAIKNLPQSSSADSKLLQTNKACAVSNEASDCDNASYYAGLSSVPTTGAENLGLQTMIMLTALVGGIGVRKLIRGF